MFGGTMKKYFIILLSLVFAGCSSTTVVRSTDKDARIYVNGEFMGTGSATYTDTKIVGAVNSVTLKKKGCRDADFSFSRSEEFDVGACIGGVLLLFPFLWIMKYKPTHSYSFECVP